MGKDFISAPDYALDEPDATSPMLVVEVKRPRSTQGDVEPQMQVYSAAAGAAYGLLVTPKVVEVLRHGCTGWMPIR